MNLQEIERQAAENGILLTTADRAAIAAAQRAESERLKQLQGERGIAERAIAFYPRLLELIIGAGETLLTLSQTLITSLGVPVVLYLLLRVEHHRVVEGILLFDPNKDFADFAAAALVILNLVLEFQTHYIEHGAGWLPERARRWSRRIWWQNMQYRLGIGDNWIEIELSPASRYQRLLRLVTFTILALALTGSMRTVIEQTPGAWYTAMDTILRQSSLLLILTWLGGLLFAGAAVLSAQGLSRYVALRCVEIIAQMQAHQPDTLNQAAIDHAGATAALAILNQRIATKKAAEKAERQRQQPQQQKEVMPPLYISNGNGNGHHADTTG